MESREAYLKQIQEAIEQRDFHRAIQLANEALAQYPDDPEITQLRQVAQDRIEAEPFLQSFMSSGISLFNSGLYQDALKQFEKVATIDPTYPELQEWISRTRSELGDAGEAPTGAPGPEAPAVELSPSQQKVQELLEKGQRLFDRGEYQEAIQVWSEVFMYDLTNEEAQKRIQQAQQAIQKKRTTIEQVLADLRAAMKANDWPRAEELVQQALQIDPENAEALQFKETMEKRAQAVQAREPTGPSAAVVSEDEMDQLVMKALQAHREGRWEEAVKLWQQVLQHDPENIGAQTKYSEALRQFRLESQIVKLIQDARTFMAAGKRDSAVHALQKAYRMRHDHPEVLNLMLEWNLTEADLEEFEKPGAAPAVEAEARGAPVKLLLLVGTMVLAGVAFLVYWQFFRTPTPTAETAQVPTARTPAPRRAPIPAPAAPPETPPPTPEPATAPEPSEEPPPQVELTPAQASRRDRYLAEAQKYWQEGELDKALETVQKALEIDPYHAQATQLQQTLTQQIEQRESAIRERLNMAVRYANSYDFEGAIFVLNQLRSQYSQREEIFEALKRAYYDLGIFYLRQVRCSDALAIFEQITLMDPEERRFQDLTPMARRCIDNNGLSAEDQRRIYSLEFLPLIENPPSP